MSSSSDSLLSSSSSDDEIIIIRRQKTYKERVIDFNKWSDEEFYSRFRLSKAVVYELLEHLRERITSRSNNGGAIKAETKILLTLRFYATGNMLMSVSDFVGVSVASAHRIIKNVSSEIASLRENFIKMLYTREELEEVALKFYNISRFPMCCGAIDCTHVRIISPGGDDTEIFRNRKGYFSLNVETVSDANLKIRNIVARWPGSCHDQTIFNNSTLKRKFENGIFGRYKLIGDSGYALRHYLFTPLQEAVTEPQRLYNESHIRTRNTVERQYGVWKRRFPILSLGMKVDINTAMTIIVATGVLHNIAISMNDVFDDEEILEDILPEMNNHAGYDMNAQAMRQLFINENFNL